MSRMPFGKFKGRPLSGLPNDYLAWLVGQAFVREPLFGRLKAEHDRRKMSRPERKPLRLPEAKPKPEKPKHQKVVYLDDYRDQWEPTPKRAVTRDNWE